MGIFERGLSIWVALAIIAGVALGSFTPQSFAWLSGLEYAKVNFPVAILIWVMIYPMMVRVSPSSISHARRRPKGLAITLIVNWLIKPFTMAALAWLFFRIIFADLVSETAASEYIAGMILLGIAPCTAMVFVWSKLTRGDAGYTLVQVSINDLIMIVAFAPLAALLLGVSDVLVPVNTLLLSVGLYVVLPLAAGLLTRRLLGGEGERMERFLKPLKPVGAVGLLLTIVLLFGFQAETILDHPFVMALIAVPLLLQSYGIFALAYAWAWKWRVPHEVAAPAAMIGTSNFFELAVAVAIGVYGVSSGAALATVVGVLVEVPVMLSLVWFANRTRSAFPALEAGAPPVECVGDALAERLAP